MNVGDIFVKDGCALRVLEFNDDDSGEKNVLVCKLGGIGTTFTYKLSDVKQYNPSGHQDSK